MFERRKSGGGGGDSLQSDLAAFNMDSSVLPAHLRNDSIEEDGGDVEVWPEHEDVVMLFIRASRQWRVAGECVLGLDYGAVKWIASLMHIEQTLELLDDLQTMESHAVELINKPAQKAKKRRKS